MSASPQARGISLACNSSPSSLVACGLIRCSPRLTATADGFMPLDALNCQRLEGVEGFASESGEELWAPMLWRGSLMGLPLNELQETSLLAPSLILTLLQPFLSLSSSHYTSPSPPTPALNLFQALLFLYTRPSSHSLQPLLSLSSSPSLPVSSDPLSRSLLAPPLTLF